MSTVDGDGGVDLTLMAPFGLTGPQVNYVMSTLGINGCEYVAGILFVPLNYEQQVYDLVKDYNLLKTNVSLFESTENTLK